MDSSKGFKLLESDVQAYLIRNRYSHRKIKRIEWPKDPVELYIKPKK